MKSFFSHMKKKCRVMYIYLYSFSFESTVWVTVIPTKWWCWLLKMRNIEKFLGCDGSCQLKNSAEFNEKFNKYFLWLNNVYWLIYSKSKSSGPSRFENTPKKYSNSYIFIFTLILYKKKEKEKKNLIKKTIRKKITSPKELNL